MARTRTSSSDFMIFLIRASGRWWLRKSVASSISFHCWFQKCVSWCCSCCRRNAASSCALRAPPQCVKEHWGGGGKGRGRGERRAGLASQDALVRTHRLRCRALHRLAYSSAASNAGVRSGPSRQARLARSAAGGGRRGLGTAGQGLECECVALCAPPASTAPLLRFCPHKTC